jgi:hypothetical protein
MQLVPYPNLSRINGNYQNKVLTVAMGIVDISNAHCYYVFAGLVPHRSSKLELSYLKTKARWVVSNLVTKPRACMSEWLRGVVGGCVCFWAATMRVVREVVHACARWCCDLWWLDGGGSLRWLAPMVLAAFVHVGGGPTHVSFRLISSDVV